MRHCEQAIRFVHLSLERRELSLNLREPGFGFTQPESPTTKLLLGFLNLATPLSHRLFLAAQLSL